MTATDAALYDLAARLGAALKARSEQVACGESCTGGWVAKCLTDVPGSSQWFACGLVTYGNDAKTRLLSVPAQLLARHGAVSEETVRAMAAGARAVARADYAVAISGVAGPDGGSPDKPVGTVWFAWCSGEETLSERCHFPGDREAVRRASVAHALRGLLELLPSSS